MSSVAIADLYHGVNLLVYTDITSKKYNTSQQVAPSIL